MAQTQSLVAARLPRDLAGIVAGYFQTHSDDPYALGLSGEHEACVLGCRVSITFSARALYGACDGGHIEMVRVMLADGAAVTCGPLRDAFTAGRRDVAWALIECIRDGGPELPFAYSCAHGGVEYAEGRLNGCVDNANYGLAAACLGNQAETMRIMVANGATTCPLCGRKGDDHAPESAAAPPQVEQ